MTTIATLLVALVALEHFWFMTLETWFWRKPLGLKTFRMTPEQAAATARLAANQGVYNGFLAVGLIWAMMSPAHGASLEIFFLACIILAGIVGALTVSPKIAIVQAGPAALALAFVIASAERGAFSF